MNRFQNPKLTPNAQRLRREMTKEERRLWYDFFKACGVPARRQKVIGPYIVDFYIAEAKLVVELDGSQHYEPEEKAHDLRRDEYLRGLGLTVLRYANSEVSQNFPGLCEDILRHIEASGQMPSP